ncbi:hypothetical protein Z945_1552 [Sulfitobacter noctilucae]|nr:hypothetical protein Z945_1552 [Sulfitobacter noctilucae]
MDAMSDAFDCLLILHYIVSEMATMRQITGLCKKVALFY